jgi:hypothetical protein
MTERVKLFLFSLFKLQWFCFYSFFLFNVLANGASLASYYYHLLTLLPCLPLVSSIIQAKHDILFFCHGLGVQSITQQSIF